MEQDLYTLLSDIFAGLTPEVQERTAVCCSGRSCSYRQLSAAIDSFANELISRGIRPGEHVGLWSFNSLNWIAAFFAIIKVGAIAVLPNYSLPSADVETLLRRTDVSVLIFGNSVALKRDPDAAAQIGQELQLRELIDLRLPENDFFVRCDSPMENNIELYCRVSSDRPGRSAFIIFTTGTTSAPKAVLLHQRGLLANAEDLALRTESVTSDSVCIGLPLFHVFGLQWLVSYLLQHKTVYLQDHIKAENIIADIRTYNIHDLATVGTIYTQMIAHPDFPKIMDIVHFCQTGGGRITPTQFIKLETAFSHARIFNGLGMTEAHGGVTEPLPTDGLERRANSLGTLGSYLEGKLIDSDGKEVPSGKVGELCIRGLTVMNGYYGMPEDQQGFDEEGWFHTGDLGYFDQFGNLCLAGRTKDIIIRNGENIAPLDIETTIIELGGVQDAKIFGAPHPVYGESVECCLLPEDPEQFDVEALRSALKEKIAGFKIPSHFFVYNEFPLLSNGKLDQKALKEDMMRRLRLADIDDELHSGVAAASCVLKNTAYNAYAFSSMVRNLSESIGFTAERVKQIGLAIEEMLHERIFHAFDENGDISVRILFLQDRLRLEFSDCGRRFSPEENQDSNLSARIILKLADSFTVQENEKCVPVYCMDFLYDSSFDIRSYLLQHSR